MDDQAFPHKAALENHGFSLRELGDIADIDSVAAYPVVCCDISGVGSAFDSPLGGAHVVSEIKKRFPTKYVVAYSGATFGPEYARVLAASDVFIRRGTPASDWANVLDRAILTLADPVEHWRRLRTVLLDHNVSIFEVFLLEDAFVRSINEHKPFVLERAIERARRIEEAGSVLESAAEGLITVAKLAVHIVA